MLTIHFGSLDQEIYHPPTFFDNQYDDAWMTTPLTKEISGGVKTLILMAYDSSGKIFNASACGDNCAKWIVRIAQEKDLRIVLHHVMDFSRAGDFTACIDNTAKIVHGYAEYLDEAFNIDER